MKRVIWYNNRNGKGYWSFTDTSKDKSLKRTYFVNFYKCEEPVNMGGGIEVNLTDFNIQLDSVNGKEVNKVWVYEYEKTGKIYYPSNRDHAEATVDVDSDDLPF